MTDHRFSRRHFFLRQPAGRRCSGQAGFGSTPSLKSLGYKSPNEKLNIASIGAGGKAASDIARLRRPKISWRCAMSTTSRPRDMFKRFEKAPKYKDFRKMLDKEGKNIDAVIVAIPDHMHATAAMWAWSAASTSTCRSR